MIRNARSFVAYTRATRPTGRTISRMLQARNYGIRSPEHDHLDVLVRWGSRKVMPPADIVINQEGAIRKASNKIACFTEAQRVMRVVPWGLDFDHISRLARDYQGIVLGRSANGFGGKDIVLYDPYGYQGNKHPRRPIKQHDFYSVYVHPTREVRIHVVGDHVIRVQGKFLDFPDDAEKNPYIRNYAHGYRFRAPRQELNRTRLNQAVMLIQALGLDFGAVDMLLFGGSRDAMLLEVNTAPSCSPLTARCYAGEIALLAEQRSGGTIRLAPEIMEAEVELPEETEYEERYV